MTLVEELGPALPIGHSCALFVLRVAAALGEAELPQEGGPLT